LAWHHRPLTFISWPLRLGTADLHNKQCLKGIVHPKMKIQPLSTHPYADGGPGEVLECSHPLWRSAGGAASTANGRRRPRLTSKNTKLNPHSISILLIHSDPSVLQPRHKKLFPKTSCPHAPSFWYEFFWVIAYSCFAFRTLSSSHSRL